VPKGYPRSTCKLCDKPVSEVGELSARGKCSTCCAERIADNYIGLRTHSGPFFRHWRERMALAVGAELVDTSRGER
jgi:hypothetical protein